MNNKFTTLSVIFACGASAFALLRKPECCVEAAESITILMTGKPEPTGNSLDLHIQGDGFFVVEVPDGSFKFTRHGAFRLDDTGDLVTHNGDKVFPGLHVPDDVHEVIIGQDGLVQARFSSDAIRTLGQIRLVRFQNPKGLRLGWDDFFYETPESGGPTYMNPGTDGAGIVRQRFLERPPATLVKLPSRHDLAPQVH